MSRNRYKRKISAKKIIGIVLVGALIVGILSSFAVFANDSKPADAIFKVGGLDENGEYLECDTSIYTEKAFDCYGLRIEPEFESTVTYDVYYYNQNNELLEVVKGLTKVYDEDFEVAEKCRIVIHPEIPDDTDIDDFKIRIWNVAKYASQLNITVDKTPDKNIDYTNLWDENTVVENSYVVLNGALGGNIDEIVSDSNGTGYLLSHKIELSSSVDGVYVALEGEYPPTSYCIVSLADEDGTIVRNFTLTVYERVDGDTWYAKFCPEAVNEDWAYMRVCVFGTNMDNVHVYTYTDN